jgi:hypothetical protein
MLRPDGADLFICRKFVSPGLGQRSITVRGFLRRELIRWLVHAGELQENPRQIVLRLVGQGGYGLNGLFEQTGHAAMYWFQHPFGSLAVDLSAYGFPIAIAIAAARNGNGNDTVARNQTKRAGMKGISHRIMR